MVARSCVEEKDGDGNLDIDFSLPNAMNLHLPPTLFVNLQSRS